MNKDQRSLSRISCQLPALLRFPDEEPPEAWGRVYELGVDTLELETRRELTQEKIVYLSFIIDEQHTFDNIRAKVVRVSRQGGYTGATVEYDQTVDRAYLHEGMKSYIEGKP